MLIEDTVSSMDWLPAGRRNRLSGSMAVNKTRQGYALTSTLKPAGYFFLLVAQ